jgi:hypothetical protein
MENHRLLTRHLAGEAELPKMEMSNRPVKILKEKEVVAAYREMMLCYILAEGIFNNKPENLIDILKVNTELQWINAGGNVLTTEQWYQICNTSSLKEAHVLQLDYTDENGSFMSFNDALNLLPYLCEGEVTATRILELCREAIAAQKRFYERVIEERTKDLSTEFRSTNPLFPYKKKEVMDDNICQTALQEKEKLDKILH